MFIVKSKPIANQNHLNSESEYKSESRLDRIIMSTIEYEAIVHHCIKTGELWEDPEFPAVQSSVFYHQTPPFSFQWKRPHVSYF